MKMLTTAGAGVGSLMIVTLLAACGGEPVAEDTGELDAGRALYVETCAVCHGPEAKGVQMLGKDLHANEFVAGLSDDELVAFLVEGRSASHPLNERGVAMPPRGATPRCPTRSWRRSAST